MDFNICANADIRFSNYKVFMVKSDQKDSQRKTPYLSNILIIYFEWLFFLGVAPFRLICVNQKSFKIHRNYVQTAVSAALTTLCILSNLSNIRMSFGLDQFKDLKNPRNHFYLASFVVAVFFQLWFTLQVWVYPEKFLNVINIMHSDLFRAKERVTCLQRKYAAQLLNLLLYATALYEPILKLFPPSILLVQGNMWNMQTVLQARFTFFVANLTSLQETVKIEDVTNFDYFLAALYGLAFFQSSSMGFSQYLILLNVVLSVWMASSTFASELQNDIIQQKPISHIFHASKQKTESGNVLKWALVYEKYNGIRLLCHYTNEACGSLLAVFLACVVVSQAAGMDSAFVMQDVIMKIRYIFVISLSYFTLVVAADICSQLSKLKIWLSKEQNRRNISMDQLNLVLMELNNRDVGIQGCEVFTVTYSLLWNILSTSITYFMICIQARQESSNQAENLLEPAFRPSTS